MNKMIRSRKTILLSLVVCICFIYSEQAVASALDPVRPNAELLQQQVHRYTEILQNGGWGKITLSKKKISRGEAAPCIRQVKRRLQITGDYADSDTSSVFTAALEEAIRKAQRLYGLSPNGVLDAALVAALNVPVQERLQQLQVNLQRLQDVPPMGLGKHLVVNIPEYKLHVFEDGRHIFDMAVVVGKPSSRTEVFNSELTQIVFSPYWNVPPSIVRNEILPAMQRKKNYLQANGYEITGQEGGLPVIRQKPGSKNSLGLVKFLFPNEHSIYFHDTPAKALFSNTKRANSHGCVRLAEPARLAEYLLQEDPEWTAARISSAMQGGKEQWVKLQTPVPVSITYFTAWVDGEGELHFREDIYGLDKTAPVAVLTK